MIPRVTRLSPLLTLTFAGACSGPDPIIGTWDLRSRGGYAFPLTEEIDYECSLRVSVEVEVDDDLDGTRMTRNDYSADCDADDYIEIAQLEIEPEGGGDYEITEYADGEVTFYACEIDGDDELDCLDGGDLLKLKKR